MMSVALLEQSRRVLDGTTTVPSRQISRVAALLLRQALEDAAVALCAAMVDPLDHPVTMQSRLAVLRALGDPRVARQVGVAWLALSGACHHHAYELSPSSEEIRDLHAVVAGLIEQVPSAPGQ